MKAKSEFITGIVTDPIYMAHQTVEGHPERPERLEVIYDMLDIGNFRRFFHHIPARPAENKELLAVHSPEYIKRIAATDGKEFSSLTPDTSTSEHSYRAALMAAGGLFQAVAASVSGAVTNAFVLARPPGHHAEKSRAMGYCLLNNAALAAAFAREQLGLKRILIVDWDVHHGNGTQHIFEQDASVLFFSIHQRGLFPGTGVYMETGIGKGEGFSINAPIPKGYGDGEYVSIFQNLLCPVALEFEPELVIVSAGFDAHKQDRMAGMTMSCDGFACLTRCLMEIADMCCNGALVLTLEGGYHIDSTTQSVKAVLDELSGVTKADIDRASEKARAKKVKYVLHRSVHVHRAHWKSLRDTGRYG